MASKEVANTSPVQFDVTGQTPVGIVAETGDQLTMDTIGDKLALRFLGKKWANADDEDVNNHFMVLSFEDAAGTPFQMNAGAKLRDAFSDIDPGRIVVLQYVKDIDTGNRDPMKDYRVEVY